MRRMIIVADKQNDFVAEKEASSSSAAARIGFCICLAEWCAELILRERKYVKTGGGETTMVTHSYQAPNPFADETIRNWVFVLGLEEVDEFFPVQEIATMGSHPFEEDEFDAFLDYLGFLVTPISNDTTHMILGHSDWSEIELLSLLRLRSGKELRVYSQEMFLAYFITWLDPLEAKELVLDEFSRGHDGLEYLKNIGFDWPSTRIVPAYGFGDATLTDFGVPETGLLKSMGYKVGKNSWLSDYQRHRILDEVFHKEIRVGQFAPDYVAEWGRPGTPQRLKKMADSLATFSKNGQMRQHHDMSKAVRDWSTDLKYLKQTYYLPLGFSFQWPDTRV